MSVLYFEWEPRPAEIEQALATVADYVENVELPLLGARRIGMEDMQRHFETESDPDGRGWKELSEDYADWKDNEGYGDEPLLVLRDRLRPAAVSEEAWLIVGEDLVFNADALPMSEGKVPENYGLVHQFGSSTTPRRSFIGLSDRAEAEIIALFDQWYDDAGLLYIRPSGVAQHRAPSGRFGPKFTSEF